MANPLFNLIVFGLTCGALIALLWPRWGLLSRFRRGYRAGVRVGMEDALKHLYKTWRQGREASVESVAGALEVSQAAAARLLQELRSAQLVRDDTIRLTDEGRSYALRIIRTHRLWERYLADRTGVAPGDWHELAEEREHHLTDEAVEALDARLGRPRFDPHGDPIPTSTGDLPAARGVPLTRLEEGGHGVISHLEDEPRALYDRLVTKGLSPGMRLEVLAPVPGGLRIAADGRVIQLEPTVAGNVTIVRVDAEEVEAEAAWEGITLEDLGADEEAEVVGLSPACQGIQRRRLLDLGIVPGTRVAVELSATAGDPTAFRIRGALIALRREQQRWVRIRRAEEAAA
ncbi:MAG: DtxR family transcriptional regulator [Gemmatimonadales bacterium]|nr:MAG: DtxR family transcriptional regulator [Gemmatimonadales bacterium]